MNRYLVLLMRTEAFDTALIEPHRDFLAQWRGRGQLELAGGFSDRSGGAYLLRAESLDAANAIAATDPLVIARSSLATVYEWNAA